MKDTIQDDSEIDLGSQKQLDTERPVVYSPLEMEKEMSELLNPIETKVETIQNIHQVIGVLDKEEFEYEIDVDVVEEVEVDVKCKKNHAIHTINLGGECRIPLNLPDSNESECKVPSNQTELDKRSISRPILDLQELEDTSIITKMVDKETSFEFKESIDNQSSRHQTSNMIEQGQNCPLNDRAENITLLEPTKLGTFAFFNSSLNARH